MLGSCDHKWNLPFAAHVRSFAFILILLRGYNGVEPIVSFVGKDISLQKSLASCAGLSNLSNFRFCAADTLQVPRHDLFKVVAGRLCVCMALQQLRPGFLSPSAGLKFADIPNGLAAVSKVPVAGWAQIAAYFGFVEFSGGFDDYKTGTPGDYGFKVLTSSDPEEKTKKLSAELANGRLAMMAIIGMFFQDIEDQRSATCTADWTRCSFDKLRKIQFFEVLEIRSSQF